MKRLLDSPYTGLIVTGAIASIALYIESRLIVSRDTHFLLQFVWVGVVSASLLTFALHPALNCIEPLSHIDDNDDVEEWFDSDRAWLQTHPDAPAEHEQE
jgi:hypothetical protein